MCASSANTFPFFPTKSAAASDIVPSPHPASRKISAIFNPVFSRTTLGYRLPGMAGAILTSCLFALLILVIIDFRGRPKHQSLNKTREFLFPLEFILLPIVGFFFSTLPALISHTQLMLGKRLEYKVTEKI